jgi:hypothetical protein
VAVGGTLTSGRNQPPLIFNHLFYILLLIYLKNQIFNYYLLNILVILKIIKNSVYFNILFLKKKSASFFPIIISVKKSASFLKITLFK